MASSTREKLIKVAHDLFYRDGFHSVGLDRLLDEVSVTKTTFYNHFQSKDELMLEVLRWHDRWWQDRFRELLRLHGGDRPRDQLLNAFDALEEMFASREYNGCIFINVAVEFPLPHDPAHIAAAEHKAAMEGIIGELAAYAGAADPKAFAEEFAMILEGSYVTRQVSRSHQTAKIGRRLARMLVDRHMTRSAGADASVEAV
jgi:AcrR family transcriptional regulator